MVRGIEKDKVLLHPASHLSLVQLRSGRGFQELAKERCAVTCELLLIVAEIRLNDNV